MGKFTSQKSNIFKNRFRMAFTRTMGGVFSFLMALTRLTAIAMPLKQNEVRSNFGNVKGIKIIDLDKNLVVIWLSIFLVWLFTGLIAFIAAFVKPDHQNLVEIFE